MRWYSCRSAPVAAGRCPPPATALTAAGSSRRPGGPPRGLSSPAPELFLRLLWLPATRSPPSPFEAFWGALWAPSWHLRRPRQARSSRGSIRSGLRVSGFARLTFYIALAGVLFCALSAAMRARWPFAPALAAATVLVAIAVFDIMDILMTPGLSVSDAGSGLWLTAAAGLAALVACSAGLALARQRPQG